MKPTEVSKRLGIPPSTIRKYSNEFARFMSPTGMGGSGQHRDFNDRDLDVLAFIKTEKNRGRSQDEISITLESFRARDYADLPGAPEALNTASVEMIPAAAASIQQSALLYQVSFLERQVADLKASAGDDKERLIELSSKLSAAQTELELWRSGRIKSADKTTDSN